MRMTSLGAHLPWFVKNHVEVTSSENIKMKKLPLVLCLSCSWAEATRISVASPSHNLENMQLSLAEINWLKNILLGYKTNIDTSSKNAIGSSLRPVQLGISARGGILISAYTKKYTKGDTIKKFFAWYLGRLLRTIWKKIWWQLNHQYRKYWLIWVSNPLPPGK